MKSSLLHRSGTASNGLRISSFLYTIIIALMLTGIKGIVNYLSFGLLILIFLIYYLGTKKGKLHLNSAIVCFIMFIVFYIFTSLPNINTNYFLTYTSYYVLAFSPLMLLQSLIDADDEQLIKCTLFFGLVVWFAIAIISTAFYISHPSVTRLIAGGRSEYANSIFGGYQLAYGSALLLVYLLQFLTDSQLGRKYRIICWIACIVLFVEIYLTESTLTTFATIIGIIAWVFLDRKDPAKRKRSNLILGTILLAILFSYIYYYVSGHLYEISSWLSSHSDAVINRRLSEILNRVFYSQASGHYTKRTDTLRNSFSLFIQSPLIGWGYKYGNVFSEGQHYGIGNHSEVLDALARYGLIGGIPFLCTYLFAMRDYCKKRISLVFTIFVLMFFNPFLYFQSQIPIFYFIPLMEYLVKKRVANGAENRLNYAEVMRR